MIMILWAQKVLHKDLIDHESVGSDGSFVL